ncbi:MAG: hypothetical protein ABI678_14215 [Kofleriaceae bacterium]
MLEAPHGEAMPAEIASACDLARTRCSRCHTLDRIVHRSIAGPRVWQDYVHRMRTMPGSAIRTDEEPVLVRCFVFRSFGSAGVAGLSPGVP